MSQEMSERNVQSDSSSKAMKVTLLGNGWTSSTGGLATLNRELAIQLSQHPEVDVCLLVPDGHCTDEDKSEAEKHRITIVSAKKRPGYDEPLDWLGAPPEGHKMDVVVGHGTHLGRQVQFIKDSARFHNCKWVHVVHTAPEDLSKYKDYPDRISKGEKKHEVEVELCKLADLVVPIGPRLEEVYSSYLQRYKRDMCIFPVIPGLFDREFGGLEQFPYENAEFKVLLCGRADEEDFELKGYNLAAKAFTDHRLQRKRYSLLFVGAPDRKQEQVRERLLQCGIAEEQLTVKTFVKSREKMKDLLCEVNLAIMPSKSEGFGLVALEALSAGLPILVNGKSGFARALEELPCSDLFILNSDEPAKWAKAIEDVCISHRKRLKEIAFLRTSYDKQYSWKEQCGKLVEKLWTMVHGSCNGSVRLPEGESLAQQQSAGVTSLDGFCGQQSFCNGEKKGSGGNEESESSGVQQRSTKQNTSRSTFGLGPCNGCLKKAREKPALPLQSAAAAAASFKGLCGQQSFCGGVKKGSGDTWLTVRIKINIMGLNGKQRREFEEFLLQQWQRFKANNDISSAEGMGDLIKHLAASHGLYLNEMKKGCLEITVECPTLDSLESLWNDYRCGQLNEILEKYLVTDEIKEKLNLENVRLQTTIPEEDYIKAKTSFMEKPGSSSGSVRIPIADPPVQEQSAAAATAPDRGLSGRQPSSDKEKKGFGVNEEDEPPGVQSLQKERKRKTSGSTIDSNTRVTVRIKINTKGLNGEQRREFEEFSLQRWQRFKDNNDISSAEGMGELIKHLAASHGLFLKEIKKGCLEITVECPTLDSLESLWNDYGCGQLNEILEKYLVTDEIKEKLNLENVRLQTTIPEEDYFKAKTSFMEKSAGSSWEWNDLAVGTEAGSAAVVATPLVLSAAGFTASRIVAGSVAATIQSVEYARATSGMFSALQSAGVLGIGQRASAAIGGTTGVATVVIKKVGERLSSSGKASEPGNNQDQDKRPEPDGNPKKEN